ncbi:DoxX family protein [Aquimarina spongiae]|uniref:DoxX-like family protein n=1 Tax=Aquimarina spongiae TaxID=570521 RepID=A0A1M6CJA3_9FLAO|nr:DoxX family protein [Aquimarina spongiae]SHI61076.1 DoxX-like family protein [Aquimarina spongiae]
MKAIYWISTLLLSAILLWSAIAYLINKEMIEGVKALGFPDFFRVQLAILKIIAVLLLLIPQVPLQAKEWAYARTGLFFITAIVAHIAHKDGWGITFLNLVFIMVLITSNVYLHKLLATR